jgi:hypothetical protein
MLISESQEEEEKKRKLWKDKGEWVSVNSRRETLG